MVNEKKTRRQIKKEKLLAWYNDPNPHTMPPYRDEHQLIIVPGSQTTLAQLGLAESIAPAAHRFPTRMFLASDGKTYEPYKIKAVPKHDGAEGEEEFIEYPDDDEGAIWPLKQGKIVNQACFFAFLQHIYNQLQPALHTGLTIVCQPSWSPRDHEDITTFVFENFKVPGFILLDSGIAATWGYGVEHAIVIDVGFEKVDISVILEHLIAARGQVRGYGGENMTQVLKELMWSKDSFTYDMAEKLKKSPICEVLPPNTPLPGMVPLDDMIGNPAAAASTGATSLGPSVKITEPPRGFDADGDEELANGEVAEDGVLDVASIVASGKTQEFLAKKEKEKADKATARKATKDREAAEAAKPTRVPNAKRPYATFIYEAVRPATTKRKTPEPSSAAEDSLGVKSGDAEIVDGVSALAVDAAAQPKTSLKKDSKKKQWEEENPDLIRQEFEIGFERFMIVDHWFIDRIADEVYQTVQNTFEPALRQNAWDCVIICGLGAKIKGFKECLMQSLINRYLISPSSASMFMSELPSALATPSAAGSMTPNASFNGTPAHANPTPSGVNQLLYAATTAANPALNNANSLAANSTTQNHSSHAQAPTSIKQVTPLTYFPEWKDFSDIDFLGGCIAARALFVVNGGADKGFMTRAEYNEDGPLQIHQLGLCM